MGKLFTLAASAKHVMKRVVNSHQRIPVETSRDAYTVFQVNNVRDQDSAHAVFAELGSSPASMKAANSLMHSDRNLDLAKLRLTPFRRTSRPSSWGAHMAFTSKKPVARTLEQRILAANGSFGVSIVRTPG